MSTKVWTPANVLSLVGNLKIGYLNEAINPGQASYITDGIARLIDITSLDVAEGELGVCIRGGVEGELGAFSTFNKNLVEYGVGVFSPGEEIVASTIPGQLVNFGDLVAGTNEIQGRTITGATSGTFTLSFDGSTTTPLPYNASAGECQAAMAALASIGTGNIFCSGGPIDTTNVVFNFQGALGRQDLPSITSNIENLDGPDPQIFGGETNGTPGDSIIYLGVARTDHSLYLLPRYTGLQK